MSDLINSIFEELCSLDMMLVTAESCTGGLIAKTITDVPGASKFFDRGFVTYSDQSKIDMLGVFAETIYDYGAVSEQTAREMAEGALLNSASNVAVAVTGIAGPDGGTPQKPVGLVYIAVAIKITEKRVTTETHEHKFSGTRDDIRNAAMNAAFTHILERFPD